MKSKIGIKPRISMITLGVSDLEKSIVFYEEGFGFPRMESPPEVAFFTLNGSWLGLFSRDAIALEAGVSPTGSGFNSFNLVHMLASEAEVDEVIAHALSVGATLSKQAEKTSWGGFSGYIKDPDNHLWEIAHNPFFWVGPKDN